MSRGPKTSAPNRRRPGCPRCGTRWCRARVGCRARASERPKCKSSYWHSMRGACSFAFAKRGRKATARVREHRARRRRRASRHRRGRSRQPARSAKWSGPEVAVREASAGRALCRRGDRPPLFSEAEIASRKDAAAKTDKLESIELPLILEGGKIPASAKESRTMRRRGAACVTPSGHTVIAMATTDSDEAAALALARVGCTRAVALDRGSHRPTFLHRSGGGMPPLARYDESVLYAISRPMTPRAYRWNVRLFATRENAVLPGRIVRGRISGIFPTRCRPPRRGLS